MISIQPIQVNSLFPKLNNELILLLKSLPEDQWYSRTACEGWDVKDIVQHLIKDYLGVLSKKRDKYKNPNIPSPKFETNQDLVTHINEMNQLWVNTTKTVSPQLLVELLEFIGNKLFTYFDTVDLLSVDSGVSWISDERLPNWMDIAREYTEHWLHQAHIRDALKAPLLNSSELFHPFICAYLLAIPKTYMNVNAPIGYKIQIHVQGDAGGTWYIERQETEWNLLKGIAIDPKTIITLDQDILWRLFSKGVGKETAQSKVKIEGDTELGEYIFNTVSLIA